MQLDDGSEVQTVQRKLSRLPKARAPPMHGDALPCVLMTSRLSVELTKLAARDSWVPFFPRWLERQLWRGAVNEALAEMQERVASALVGEYEDWSKRPAVTPASE